MPARIRLQKREAWASWPWTLAHPTQIGEGTEGEVAVQQHWLDVLMLRFLLDLNKNEEVALPYLKKILFVAVLLNAMSTLCPPIILDPYLR